MPIGDLTTGAQLSGLIGTFYGIKFIESIEAKIFAHYTAEYEAQYVDRPWVSQLQKEWGI